jgi:hypothetical protein
MWANFRFKMVKEYTAVVTNLKALGLKLHWYYTCVMRWAGHVARMGEGRVVYRFLVGKPEGERPLGRPRRRWEDNIEIDLQEVGGGCGD